jgi:hypothetical protein
MTSDQDDWNMTRLFESIRIGWLTLSYYRTKARRYSALYISTEPNAYYPSRLN